MTVQEFAAMTQRVIDANGFDDFLPTACYPEQRVVTAIQGIPVDVDLESAVLKAAQRRAKDKEEFLVAFKSGASEFTVIRLKGKKRESAKFVVEGA